MWRFRSGRHAAKQRTGARGFTLIELLVVVAIIAILAAILFPILNAVKANARSSACVSNLRQIGSAVRTYSDDWGGYMPDCVKIGPFIPLVQELDVNWPQKLHVKVQPYVKNRTVFHCPGDGVRKSWVDTMPTQSLLMYEAFGSSYQTYGQIDLVQQDWNPVTNRLKSDLFGCTWPIQMSLIPHPSSVRIVRDAIPWHIRRESPNSPWKWNELCADGHVFTYKSSYERGGSADNGVSADTGGIL